MIDIKKAKSIFYKYLNDNKNDEQPGFLLKVDHTMYVLENAKDIASNLGLDNTSIELAQLIGLLHDIGRFYELFLFKKFESVKFDHALYGVELLFNKGLIREFISDSSYDNIIKEAIFYHNKLSLPSNLDDRCLMHCKIIRDADILDNFRVKRDVDIRESFPSVVNDISDLEDSFISDEVYDSIINKRSVDIKDRETPLDYWVCILGFVFNLSFKESLLIVKNNNYINILIDKFKYNNIDTKKKMEVIRDVINKYLEDNSGSDFFD